MKNDLVSIIMLSRNKEQYVEASVRSVMAQTYQNNHLGDSYDETWLRALTANCCFHKLNGRLWKEAEGKEDTYLCKIKEMFAI